MSVVVLSAPAKLTLSLRVVGRRDDGLHLLDAEMVAIDLADHLHVSDGDGLQVVPVGGGLEVVEGDDNLVARALRLAGRSAAVVVYKAIPAGAGLGGGSSDAAAILRWAGWTDVVEAAAIGADVSFCMVGGRARVTGVGEVVEPLEFRALSFTLLTPPVGCRTADIYRRWDELGGPAGESGNDLEPAALDLVPDLARWRDDLGDATGLCPRLAGSGSTWFVEGEYPGGGRQVVSTLPPT
jgi:4-diphosphocytidyl-2-C-methyl-D-erythritol kinase